MKKQNRKSSARGVSGGKAGKRSGSPRKGKSTKRKKTNTAKLSKFVQAMNEFSQPFDSKDSHRR